MRIFAWILVGLSAFSETRSEIYTSEEFGFFVDLPSQVETVKLATARGPLTTIASFSEENGLLYMVTVFEIQELKSFAEMNDETSKIFLEGFLKSMMAEIQPTDTKSEFADGFAWPMLKFSYREVSKFKEGVESQRTGYSFVHNKSVFTLSIYRFPDSAELGTALDRFTQSFAFGSESDISTFRKQTIESSKSLFNMAQLETKVKQRRLMVYGRFQIGMKMVAKFSNHGVSGDDVLKTLSELGNETQGLVAEYWEAERGRDFLQEIENAEKVSRPIAITRSLDMEMRSQFYERHMAEIRDMVEDLKTEAINTNRP